MSIWKKIRKRFLVIVGSWIAAILVRILRRTIKFEIEGIENLEESLNLNKGVILAFWHGGMLIPMMAHYGQDITVLVSEHADGEIIARVLGNLGFPSIRGSATRGGRYALKEMTALLRDNRIMAITPDGPSGPYHECKAGLVVLAARTGAPILPMVSAASHFTILRSWDRFQAIWPWTRCSLRYGSPLTITRSTSPNYLRDHIANLENELESLGKKVQKDIGVSPVGIPLIGHTSNRKKAASEKVLELAASAYKGIIFLRNKAYDEELIKQRSLPVPVISIGNITLGGTGKTPTAIMLAEYLIQNGRKPAVISRGYKRRSKGVRIVSDGTVRISDWREAGDEAALMARRLKGVPVIVGADRYKAGSAACRDFNCNVIVLDDGYQHRRLERDLNIVLLNSRRPFGNGKIFPAGSLREPPASLERADVIIASKGTGFPKSALEEIRRYTEAPVFITRYVPRQLIRWDEGERIPLSECRGLKAVAFAGLAEPDHFFGILREKGIELCREEYYSDHYPYGPRDLHTLRSLLKRTGSDMLLTTAKDCIRIDPSLLEDCPLYYLDTDWEIQENREEFFQLILKAVS